MFFTECARLAEQHPDLALVFEQIDSQFHAMGTAEVVRPGDLASFLNVDPNRMRSALDLLAGEALLLRVEMVECRYCQMAALRSDYQQALEEDGEYRCTSCDRPLTSRAIQIITTYRRGERWRAIPNPQNGSGDVGLREAFPPDPAIVRLDEQGWYTHDRLAEAFGVGKDALRKRLDRFRDHALNGWKTNEDRRPREAKYLYQLRAVMALIEELRASSQRPAK